MRNFRFHLLSGSHLLQGLFLVFAWATIAHAQDTDKRQAGAEKWADNQLKNLDKNGNGTLEEAEFSEAGNIIRKADTDSDKVITRDELIVKGGGKATSTPSAAAGKDSDKPAGDKPKDDKTAADKSADEKSTADKPTDDKSTDDKSTGEKSKVENPKDDKSAVDKSKPAKSADTKKNKRKSYRFLAPTERLPKEVPSWFSRDDSNGDGQVSMAEFTSTWTDAKVDEFSAKDLNGDGFITAAECLKFERQKLKKK